VILKKKPKSVAHDFVIVEMMTHLLTLKIWWLYMALSAKLCWPNDHTQRNGDPSINSSRGRQKTSPSVFHCFWSSQWKTAIQKINLETLWPKLQDDLLSSCTTTFPISLRISNANLVPKKQCNPH
jgi:hypothetical protein